MKPFLLGTRIRRVTSVSSVLAIEVIDQMEAPLSIVEKRFCIDFSEKLTARTKFGRPEATLDQSPSRNGGMDFTDFNPCLLTISLRAQGLGDVSISCTLTHINCFV